jgi:hypothetical protein
MIDHISHTQVAMLLRCGEEYRRTYVEQEPRPLAPAIVIGQVYHRAIEYGLRARLTDGTELSVAEIRQVAEDAWTMAVAGQAIAWNGEDPEPLRQKALALAALYWEEAAMTVQPQAVEAGFQIAVPGVDVPFVGVIDLIDGDILVDHKTASQAWSQYRADSDLQANAYLYAHERQTGTPAAGFRFDVAVKGGRMRIQQLATSRSEAQLEWYERLLQAAWRLIQAGTFLPNPTAWNCCLRYCPFWAQCVGQG